jgi:hypothetical protein
MFARVQASRHDQDCIRLGYGIQGNESSRDQNINHFINAIRAVNKPEAFKVKTDVLDDLGNAAIPGRDASDTELNAGVDLWIPSFGVAAKMDVSSGTATGEVTRYAKKFDQKIEDFGAACRASGKYMSAAIGRNAGEMAMGMLQGLIDFALDAAKILAASTAAGALVGALFGGVGAAPGAAIGFEIGLLILEYYGLYMLAEAVLGVAGNLMGQLGQFIALAWDANGDKAKIEKAGQALAEALGILVSALLVVAAAYLLKRGANALGKTKFAQKVGETRLAKWFEERQKGTTTKEQLAKEKAAREKTAKEPVNKEPVDKEPVGKEQTTADGIFHRSVEFTPSTGRNYKVFQRSDINWNQVRTGGDKRFLGKTNAEAAQAGLRPQLPDGNFATLHHSQQSARGPWFETSTRYHNIANAKKAPLHPHGGEQHPHFPLGKGKGSLREDFQRIESPEYWQWREKHR